MAKINSNSTSKKLQEWKHPKQREENNRVNFFFLYLFTQKVNKKINIKNKDLSISIFTLLPVYLSVIIFLNIIFILDEH